MNTPLHRESRPFHRRRARLPWVAVLALAALAASAGFATPLHDHDADGVPDRLDLCPTTPRGAALLDQGCSALDLALTPETAIAPVRSRLEEQAAALLAQPGQAEAGRRLREVSQGLAEAEKVMRSGDVCRAADLFAAAVDDLKAGEQSLENGIHAEAPRLLATRDERTGLAEGAMAMAFLRVHQNQVQQATDQAGRISALARAGCDQIVETGSLRGRVLQVDDASRTFRLAGDHLVGIAAGSLPPGLMAGRRIDGRGVRFADGTALLTSLRSDLPASGPAPKTTGCLVVSIAPFQQFPPFKANPSDGYTLRERIAYGQGIYGVVNLESLQRLAAVGVGCAPGNGLTTYSYKLKIDITQGASTWTVANDLKEGDTPVALPPLVSGQLASVTAATYRTACTFGFGCGAPQVQGTEGFPLVVYPFGSYAKAIYDKTVFDVGGNQSINDWEPAKVTALTLSHVPDPNPTLYATGYKVTNNHPSDFPTNVTLAETFAVYETDDLYDDTADGNTNLAINGIDHVAGLSWPRIIGHNPSNNKVFEYAVDPPDIVRDRVFDCAGSTDSFYYLPYTGGYPSWTIIKGNSDDPTVGYSSPHEDALAFGAPTAGDVYAARGGLVVALDESHATNDPDPVNASSIGNWVSIRHEDGTFGFYFHLAQNGVLVNVGDRVFRDWHIAEAGGNRLVFEVGEQCPPLQCGGSGYTTRKALYEVIQAEPFAGAWVPGALLECKVPRVGDKLLSTSNTL